MRKPTSVLLLPLLATLFLSPAHAAENGETRCGARGTVETYRCSGGNCYWQPGFEKCASQQPQAQACNTGDTKCGADGFVYRCDKPPYMEAAWRKQYGSSCAADRDPADNAPVRRN